MNNMQKFLKLAKQYNHFSLFKRKVGLTDHRIDVIRDQALYFVQEDSQFHFDWNGCSAETTAGKYTYIVWFSDDPDYWYNQ